MKLRLTLGTSVLLLAAVFRLWQIAEIPPGLHPDEAFHLLNAQLIASGQNFPIYITGNNGNEPLFAYSAALVLLLLGPVTWAGRLAAAWIGIIGVAATVRLGDEMFPRQGVGWLAGGALAALFWNVDFSRFGSQPIWAATAAAATMAALWRGARTGSPWAFFLAGVSLGLGLDAYVAFRLFPAVPLISGLALLVASRDRRRAMLAGGAVAGLGTALVYAPLGLWFIQHPEWFFNRFSETTAGTLGSGQSGLAVMAQNGLKTLGSLLGPGDQNWRHNIAGRPALDAAQAFFAALAALALIRRWRQPQLLTLLAWILVGLAPSVVTTEAPHFGRTTAVTPALALLIGLGVRVAWQWARPVRTWHALIVIAGLLSVMLTAVDYFGRWANNSALLNAFAVEQVDLARALQNSPAGAQLLLPDLVGPAYTVEYVLGEPAYRHVEFYSSSCLVLPVPATEPAAYAVVNPQRSTVLPGLQQAYPAASWHVTAWHGGQPYLGVLQIPAGQPPLTPVAVTRGADFGGFVRMVGYSLSPGLLRPGGNLTLHVLWQIEQQTPTALKNFVHLLGTPKADGSRVYAQRDSQPCADTYATTGWATGDELATDMTLNLPADLPAGTYTLQTGWYDAVTGARAPVTDDAGPHQNDAAQLPQILVH